MKAGRMPFSGEHVITRPSLGLTSDLGLPGVWEVWQVL